MYICKFLILCGFLDWSFKPSIPYASYRLFHLYHVSLDIPNAIQTSDIVLPECSGSIIILYLFSISTCFTLQDWSVNYVRKLKCQLCMEAAQLVIGNYHKSIFGP